MKILHVGWGYRPLRAGGLIEYSEDLMEIQSQNNYMVGYFCPGEINFGVQKPYLKIWQHRKGFNVFEIINSPIQLIGNEGTLNPEDDYKQIEIEKFFNQILKDFSPDVVHFQEFFALPTSLVKICNKYKIKTVYTIEDYYPICPTLKLLNAERLLCIRKDNIGLDCINCCKNAKKISFKFLLRNKLKSFYNKYTNSYFKKLVKDSLIVISKSEKSNESKSSKLIQPTNNLSHGAFTLRREKNIENIASCDLLVAMSNRVSEIYNHYYSFKNMIVLNLTVKHIDSIKPKKITIEDSEKIHFVGINVLGGYQKGGDLMFDVFERIQTSTIKNKVIFNFLGGLDSSKYGQLLKKYDFVNYLGSYHESEINNFLDKANGHVGIVPSVWEEAYGFVGIEFLAKGMPVIGNKMGGITDYVKNGETGWLNNTSTSNEMFEIIVSIVNQPKQIEYLNRNILKSPNTKTMNSHYKEMDLIYRELINHSN